MKISIEGEAHEITALVAANESPEQTARLVDALAEAGALSARQVAFIATGQVEPTATF